VKPSGHYRTTRDAFDPPSRLAGALAVLPDAGVVMQRAPSMRVRRWGAQLHQPNPEGPLFRHLYRWDTLGAAWGFHQDQDEATHPRGTYVAAELAQLDSATRDDMVVSYSAGPDSFIMWRLLDRPPGVYVDVGNESAQAERDLMYLADAALGHPGRTTLTVANVPVLKELPTGWIPYRNLWLILACARVSPNVMLGRIAEWGPDKNPAFFRQFERLLKRSRGGHFQAATHLPQVKIRTPVGHLTKTALVRRFIEELGREQATAELLRYTRSCYANLDDQSWCGRCGACWCRWVAFHNNGIHEEDDRYQYTPTRAEYYRRLHPGDFRPSMLPMYVKRQLEMRGHG
jgi:7-cyano-7-deazaguanine synthase in queuosine biosynthesis